MSKELAVKYANLKLEIKKLEEEMKSIQPEVLKYIQEAVQANIPARINDLGNFSWYPKKVYTYSDEYEKLCELAEERKKEELAKGTYKNVVETPILIFKELKN